MGIFTKSKIKKLRRSEPEIGTPKPTFQSAPRQTVGAEVSGEKEKISQESKRESAGKTGTENAASGSKRKLLIKQVWITEKASNSSNFGKYVFVVDKSANKSEIKKAIESIYSVKVVGVNTVNSKSKSKRLGRSTGKTSGYKKAIVALKEGQKIDVIPT